MVHIRVIDRSGVERNLEAETGLSLMEAIRENGIDDLMAICGGCCSCATCHVYVSGDRLSDLPGMSGDEDELLESSVHRRPQSRLSCQIPLEADLDGLTVTIALED